MLFCKQIIVTTIIIIIKVFFFFLLNVILKQNQILQHVTLYDHLVRNRNQSRYYSRCRFDLLINHELDILIYNLRFLKQL